jgi:hypothetical protein
MYGDLVQLLGPLEFDHQRGSHELDAYRARVLRSGPNGGAQETGQSQREIPASDLPQRGSACSMHFYDQAGGNGHGPSICRTIIRLAAICRTRVMQTTALPEFTLPAYAERRIVSTWRRRDAGRHGAPTSETIFLIDDDVSVREGLAGLIESLGLQCRHSRRRWNFLPLSRWGPRAA